MFYHATVEMFVYHSEQRHSDFVQGKGETRIQRVEIKGAKGHKEVEYQDASGKTTRRVKIVLKPREVEQIKKNQYINGLFQECDDNMCEWKPLGIPVLSSLSLPLVGKTKGRKGTRKVAKGRR